MFKPVVGVAVVLMMCACGAPSQAGTPTGSGHPASPARLASPSPDKSPQGTPVAAQILAPAKVLPVVGLCTAPLFEEADGNAEPQYCRDGSINVEAWRYYNRISPNILGAGPQATVDEIHAAFRADGRNHPTSPMEQQAYHLAAAYYGWTFTPDPSCWLWGTTNC